MAGNTKAVLLSVEQVAVIKRMQDAERKKSPFGSAPSIHQIARGLMDKALQDIGGDKCLFLPSVN
jgi:hypothetical protein